MFFQLSTLTLFLLLAVIAGTCITGGVLTGRTVRARPGANHEPVGVVQGTLLGLIGLLLAFGLSMAVGRFEFRRTLVVQEANDIGTTYLRAQLLAEPTRTTSLGLLRQYTDAALDLAHQVPDTHNFNTAAVRVESLQRQLWTAAGDAVRADPVGTAPRLYLETLNNTIDTHADRMASMRNRVPTPVLLLEVFGSGVALGVLALYLTLLGRGITTSLATAALLVLILFASFDLDRPQRGFITVPSTPLAVLRTSMDLPPEATGP
ncbi:unannotated protein [freshwater metagenome]|uniref:Unannotated protein n=1 Tax=freshwater metagenome TaxID=449393 RepID=A0A6J7F279_9ZZZZ|nr:hypothetical protein [Actinomycetota bacterium]